MYLWEKTNMLKSKKLIIIFLLTTTLSSCENIVSANINTETKEVVKEIQTNELSDDNDSQDIVKISNYNGMIDNIEIHMYLEFLENGKVIGEYTYGEFNISIPLSGYVEGAEISLATIDESDKFRGIIKGSYISGEWSNSDKTLKFHLNNEELDEYATFTNMKIAYENNFACYIVNGDIYRYNFSDENTVVILEEKALDNIILYKDMVYFIDTDDYICRISVNGGDLERFEIYDNVTNFIIYKDVILFTDVKYAAEDIFKIETVKIQKVNIDGSLIETIDLPKDILVSSETEKLNNYYISCVYNDYIYLNSLEYGTEANFFRVNQKNSKTEKINGLGEIIEPIDDEIIYLSVNSSNILKENILIDDKNNYLQLYSGPDIYKNDDLQYFDIVSNHQFIVIGYTMKYDDQYTIDILNLGDNCISTVSIDKRIEDTGLNDTLNMCIIGNSIYYYYSNAYDNTMVELNKIVIN